MRISVIGTGYLGATHAAGMAELGFEVIGVDTDPDKIEALAAGRVPFHEPGLPELLQRHVASGRLRFTTDLAQVSDADVHFICVGTPQGPSGAADTRAVHGVAHALVAQVSRPTLIVGKSTVPVGTAQEIAAMISASRPDAGIELAWNPEFLREGFAVQDTLHPDRLVFGVGGPSAELTLRKVYTRAIEAQTPVVVSDLPTAELVKVSANAFLATKISFINAMAEICERTGADVTTLADAIGHDARIGRRFLNSGLGFGGGCLAKDIRALVARAEEIGCSDAVGFLRDVDAINLRRRDRVVELTTQAVGDVSGVRLSVLGAAFKPDSDDVRDSPALEVARRLAADGGRVTVFDPAANLTARAVAPQLRYAANAFAACRQADLVLLLTEWPELVGLDPVELGAVVRRKVIIDARNALDRTAWSRAGWTVIGPGRPQLSAPTPVVGVEPGPLGGRTVDRCARNGEDLPAHAVIP